MDTLVIIHSYSWGASIDVHGVPLTDETIAEAKACDAVLMGSIGGDAKTSPWYKLEPSKKTGSRTFEDQKSPESFCKLKTCSTL